MSKSKSQDHKKNLISSGKEYIGCEHTGEQITTRYNGQYLKEAIEHLSSSTVEIYLSSAQTAAVLKPVKQKENTDQTALLMPLRANADV